ncbi:ATP-grasp ribosomal peptide maturase [Streptomyces sp. NPDC002911]
MRGHTVLVATEYEDATADLVIAELNRRRVPVLRFDPGRDLTAAVGLAARLGRDGWEGTLTVRDRTADLAEVRSLYHRRPSPFAPAGGVDQAARFAAGENRRGLGGVLAALPRCRYLSHPSAIARAEYKPEQLAAALDVGMLVPRTVITNDRLEAQAFTAARPTIYKPLHAGAYDVDGEPAGIWAGTVRPHQLDDTVGRCAHLFQAQVDKVADIRAVVVGREVFCVRITAPPGVVDWRAEYRNLSYASVDCPQDMRHALLRYLDTFDLAYGAFDFAVSRDGTWWFLECNPNGQWAWLEAATALPLTHAIADLLEQGEERR